MRRKCVLIVAFAVVFVGLRWVEETSARQEQGRGGGAGELGCYDANGDGGLDLSDPVFLLNHLFSGGPAPVACAESCAEFCGLTPDEVARLRELLPALEEREFGRRLAGTWFGGIGTRNLVQVFALTTDGNAIDIGDTDIGSEFLELGSIGKWEVIDRDTRQVRLDLLAFYHDPDTREYVRVARLTTRNATVNADFTRITGLATEQRYPPTPHSQWPGFLEDPGEPNFQDVPFVMERLP